MTAEEHRDLMQKAKDDAAYREECIRAHLEKDKQLCWTLHQNGLDPYDEFVYWDPKDYVGKTIRLNDGRIVKVNDYCAYFGIISCNDGGLIIPLSVWLARTLSPELIED